MNNFEIEKTCIYKERINLFAKLLDTSSSLISKFASHRDNSAILKNLYNLNSHNGGNFMKNFLCRLSLARIVALISCVALVFCFTGCPDIADAGGNSVGNSGENSGTNNEPSPVSEQTFTVTYVDGVDGLDFAVPSDSASYHAGDTVTVKFAGVENRAAYTFAGWSDGTTTYTSGGTSTFTIGAANVILTAVWTRSSVNGKIGEYGSPYAVGDIVFNDGSAVSYSENLTLSQEQKNAAIAVIYYVGTELNNGNDTTTVRTLGVGLVHSDDICWCSADADAYNLTITTIVVESMAKGDRNGSDNLEQIAEFEGVNDATGDGAEEKYPAFYFAKNYKNLSNAHVNGTAFTENWFLPSVLELCRVRKVKEMVDAASLKCGGNQFGDNCYWAASHISYGVGFSKGWAACVSFDKSDDYGTDYYCTKGSCDDEKDFSVYQYACAVREF